MASKDDPTGKSTATLREQAEGLLRASPQELARIPSSDLPELVHELQVYHAEIEIQNEELRDAQIDLAEARDRYSNLFEFAPVAYFTVDRDGRVTNANLTAAALLGVDRGRLLEARFSDFVAREAQDTWYRHRRAVFAGDSKQTCELAILTAGGTRLVADLESVPYGSEPDRECRTAAIDVTGLHDARAALRQNERRLRRLLDAIPHGVYEIDTAGRITFANPAFSLLTGETVDDLIGVSVFDLAADADESRERARYFARILRDQPPPTPYPGKVRTADGDIFDVEIAWDYERNEDGEVTGYINIVTDVTARNRAEQDLRGLNEALEQRVADRTAELGRTLHEFRTLADNVPALFSYVDSSLRYTYVNRKYAEIFERPASSIIGEKVETIVDGAWYAQVEPYIKKALQGEKNRHQIKIESPAGPLHLDVTRVPDFNASGKVIGFFTLAHDVTELTETRAMLTEQSARLRELMGRLIDTQERQARLIARDLHDVFGQQLASVNLELARIERDMGSQRHGTDGLKAVRDRIGQLGDDLQKLSRQLHPAILSDLGLAAALKRECALFSEQHGVPVRFSGEADLTGLAEESSLALYRIAQEALRNIGRHASAREVTVTLVRDRRDVVLTVVDAGDGFDLKYARRKGGLGLVSMEERALLVGGALKIESEPGRLTTVEARIPIA
jgi:PAS domain S-box-containing protein